MLIKIKDHTYLDFSRIVSVRDDSDGGLEVKVYFEGAFFFHMYMTNRGFRRSVNKDAKKKGVKIND